MIRCFTLLVFALVLGACGHTNQSTPPQQQQQQTDSMWLTGKQAYENICADCHEEGVDGAPRTGDRDAWDGRSRLWAAVLTEHAKQGYGDMPARGGGDILSDADTAKAADYMLTLTYPEAHRD
jgi:cytochrome c oxidase cbb3-type subunit 3